MGLSLGRDQPHRLSGRLSEAYTPEVGRPAYASLRSEGSKLAPTIRRGLLYIEKWFRKKYSAPVEEKPYSTTSAPMRILAAESPPAGASVRLGLVGDLMWLRNGWDSFLAPEVLTELNRCDVLLGNWSRRSRGLRVPVVPRRVLLLQLCPGLLASFRRPDGRNSFTAVSLANNHVMDFGAAGCRQTLEFLAEQGVPQSGVRPARDEPPYVAFARNGIRFGFFAGGWGLNEVANETISELRFNFLHGLAPKDGRPVDLSLAERALDAMTADGVDFKIISLHWNFEYEWYPTPHTMLVARRLVERGADSSWAITHVQQPYEIAFINGAEVRYRDDATVLAAQPGSGCLLRDPSERPRKALIIYSLGNFATKMATFSSRIGILQALTVTRGLSGDVDWFAPSHRLVFNDPYDPTTRGRRLVFLEDYLRRSGPTEAEVVQAAFVQTHLMGRSNDCGRRSPARRPRGKGDPPQPVRSRLVLLRGVQGGQLRRVSRIPDARDEPMERPVAGRGLHPLKIRAFARRTVTDTPATPAHARYAMRHGKSLLNSLTLNLSLVTQ